MCTEKKRKKIRVYRFKFFKTTLWQKKSLRPSPQFLYWDKAWLLTGVLGSFFPLASAVPRGQTCSASEGKEIFPSMIRANKSWHPLTLRVWLYLRAQRAGTERSAKRTILWSLLSLLPCAWWCHLWQSCFLFFCIFSGTFLHFEGKKPKILEARNKTPKINGANIQSLAFDCHDVMSWWVSFSYKNLWKTCVSGTYFTYGLYSIG